MYPSHMCRKYEQIFASFLPLFSDMSPRTLPRSCRHSSRFSSSLHSITSGATFAQAHFPSRRARVFLICGSTMLVNGVEDWREPWKFSDIAVTTSVAVHANVISTYFPAVELDWRFPWSTVSFAYVARHGDKVETVESIDACLAIWRWYPSLLSSVFIFPARDSFRGDAQYEYTAWRKAQSRLARQFAKYQENSRQGLMNF